MTFFFRRLSKQRWTVLADLEMRPVISPKVKFGLSDMSEST
jgi:hypothetical protein